MLFDAAAGRAAVGSVSAGTAACVTAIRGEGSDSTDGTTLKGLATETGTISRRAAIQICNRCGTEEALEDIAWGGQQKRHLADWAIVKGGWVE